MVIACVVSVVVLLSGAVAYGVLFVSKKADREYEQLKRDIIEEMRGEKRFRNGD